jgi:hypothetical protein
MATKRKKSGSRSSQRSSSRSESNRSTSARPRRLVASDVSGGQQSADQTPETQSPAERLSSLRTEWERISGTLALTSMVTSVEDVTHNLDDLKQTLDELDTRGYQFSSGWAASTKMLEQRWQRQRREAMRLIDNERRALKNSARGVERILSEASRNHNLIDEAEAHIDAVESSIQSAEQRIRGAFSKTSGEVTKIQRKVDHAHALLDNLADASFQLHPDEDGVNYCEAIWVSDREEPEGLLFLTTNRLIFEQREKIAKKKVLFIAVKKELVQEKLWESPIGAVSELESQDKRAFLKRKELLTLRFHERTRETPGEITLQLKHMDNDAWVERIHRVQSGKIDLARSDREAPQPNGEGAETIEEDREIPTICPNCSAPLPPAFKGMQQLACDYCGTVVNL